MIRTMHFPCVRKLCRLYRSHTACCSALHEQSHPWLLYTLPLPSQVSLFPHYSYFQVLLVFLCVCVCVCQPSVSSPLKRKTKTIHLPYLLLPFVKTSAVKPSQVYFLGAFIQGALWMTHTQNKHLCLYLPPLRRLS